MKREYVPVRSCVACGHKGTKGELLRIVRTSEGEVTLDPSGKHSGRGAYLCPKETCWQTGLKKRHLERALRTPITIQQKDQLLAQYREQLNVGVRRSIHDH